MTNKFIDILNSYHRIIKILKYRPYVNINYDGNIINGSLSMSTNIGNSPLLTKELANIMNKKIDLTDEINSLINTANEINITSNIDEIKNSKKQRCPVCNKVIKLIEAEYCKCKCDNVFCSKHRNPISDHYISKNSLNEGHLCVYDYSDESKNQIIKQNPKIEHDKMKNRI